MVSYILLNCVAILILILSGAFFASSETAYTGLSRISVRQMLKNNEHNAQKVHHLKENLEFLIATVLIGTNFVTTLNSALVTAFALKVLGAEYVSYGTGVISILVIIFVEIIPKTYAANRSESWAKKCAVPLLAIEKLFFPVIWIFFQFTKLVEVLEKKIFKSTRPLITEDELKLLIAVGNNEGTLEHNETKMLERLFEFSDSTVHSIMKHRSLVRYLSVDSTLEEVLAMFQDTGFSKLPVYENDVENVIGVLHFKSVLYADSSVCRSKDFVRICMNRVSFVPETLSLVEMLQVFRKDKNNFAVAVNEYGGMSGIVTVDDILHEVFGRITDEHGSVEDSPEKRISVVNVNEFLVPGDMRLDDLNEVLYLNLKSDNFETLGGWLLERIGELPAIGMYYRYNGMIFFVEDQSARRIQTVRIKM